MLASRRDLLRASLASLAYLTPVGCRPSGALREDGRLVVSFWYAYGDLVRKVLLELVARFNASQSRIVVKAVHQGDYFEALAKLRTAIAAGAAPALSHVVLEVLPYLARAGVLEPLDDYEGAGSLGLVPALGQSGSFAAGNVEESGRGEPLYAIPFNRSTPIIFANGRWLERERVALPGTWDELAEAARAAHAQRRRRRRAVGIRGPHLLVVLGRDGGPGRRARWSSPTDASRSEGGPGKTRSGSGSGSSPSIA